MDPKYEELDNLGKWGEILDLSASELDISIEAKYWHVYALSRLQKPEEAISFLSQHEAEILSHPEWIPKFKVREGIIYASSDPHKFSDLMYSAIQLADKIGDDETSARCYLNLGYHYLLLGDYPQSIDYSLKAIKILENLTNVATLGLTHINLGNAYAQNGDYELAKENFDKGLELCRLQGNVPFLAKGCYYLINELPNNTTQASIEKYVQTVQRLAIANNNPLILTLDDYCQAVYLKLSKRSKDKSDAERLFIKIIEESKVDYDINLYSMFHLLELLLIEYRTYKEDVVLDEIELYISQMYEISTKKKMYSWIVKSSILQSRLFAIKGKLEDSYKLLEDTLEFTKKNRLYSYKEDIVNEKNLLDSQFEDMKKLIDENSSLNDRMDQMQMLAYLQKAENIVSGSI